MVKYPAFALAVLLCVTNCFADTFTHRLSGESFNGYATKITKGNKTQVRIDKKPEYLDLNEYEIEYNHLGRKNIVYSFPIKDSIDMACGVEAFEDAIEKVANQGPLFIIIQIDTQDGRIDLATRVCDAITKINNCQTIAFVSGGTYSAGAMIALACDKLYIAEGTIIRFLTQDNTSRLERKRQRRENTRPGRRSSTPITPGNFILPARPDIDIPVAYVAALAERNGRSGLLAKAMVDENVEVLEISEDGKTRFIKYKNKKPNQTVLRTWSSRGSRLALTPSDAVHCKIADNIIPSIEQLLVMHDAKDVRLIQNTDSEKAKLQFEKFKKTFSEILGSISVLEERNNELLRDLNNLEDRIRNQRIRIENYRPHFFRRRRYWYRREKDVLEQMIKEQQQIEETLLTGLTDLGKNYKEALDLANKHLDLNADADSLLEGLHSTKARYDEIQKRPNP